MSFISMSLYLLSSFLPLVRFNTWLCLLHGRCLYFFYFHWEDETPYISTLSSPSPPLVSSPSVPVELLTPFMFSCQRLLASLMMLPFCTTRSLVAARRTVVWFWVLSCTRYFSSVSFCVVRSA